MIAKNFELYRPETLEEAAAAYREGGGDGGCLYLGGGTEIVTMTRDGVLGPDALVDLKRLPELQVLERSGGRLTIGAGRTLTDIAEWEAFPLLGKAASGVADRTVRNSITIGGNIAGRLPYREAVLPFLLADTEATLAGPDGRSSELLATLFSKRLKLAAGNFLVALSVGEELADAPYVYKRKTKDSRVDYPLLTLCAVKLDGAVRFAVSGVHGYPVRSEAAEEAIRETSGSPWTRAEAAVAAIPVQAKDDIRASSGYREMLLKRALSEAIEELT